MSIWRKQNMSSLSLRVILFVGTQQIMPENWRKYVMPMSVFIHPSLFHLQYYTLELLLIGDFFVLLIQHEQQQQHRTVHFYPPLPFCISINNVALINYIDSGTPLILCTILSLLCLGPELNRPEEGEQDIFQYLIIRISYYFSQITLILQCCSHFDAIFYSKSQINLVCLT